MLASASAEYHVDTATAVPADAYKAMEITGDVARELHVNPAGGLGVDTAARDVIANALPGYSVEDRMRLVWLVGLAGESPTRRVQGPFALPCRSERDYAASLPSFAAEPLENATANRLHDALPGGDAAFRVQMADRLYGVVANLDWLALGASASKLLYVGLTIEGADQQRFMATIGADDSGTTGCKVVAKVFDTVTIPDSVRAMPPGRAAKGTASGRGDLPVRFRRRA
ncbi:hypothetical protein [Azospirillum melinis]